MPRPILKRSSPPPALPLPPVSHPLPFPDSSLRHAHFPPTPALCSTHSVHSPTSYDRSPIVVDKNSCAMPERGCPGRTYLDVDPRMQSARVSPQSIRYGEAHPRAMRVPYAPEQREHSDDDEEHTPTRTYAPPFPTYSSHHARTLSSSTARPPPLPTNVPDLCSSSSESDESSDGFASPPPEVWSYHKSSKYYSAPFPMSSPTPSFEGFASTTPTQDRPLHFLPHPNPHSPPEEAYPSPQMERRRPRRRSDEPDGSPTGERRKKKSLCKAMAGLGFGGSSSNDCLGGF